MFDSTIDTQEDIQFYDQLQARFRQHEIDY